MTRTSARVWTRLALAVLLFALVSLLPGRAAAKFSPPTMRDAVTDTAGKLSEADDRALEERITAYRNRTGNEIAVLVVASLEGKSIEDVAYETFNTWGIGKKGLDNGVLLVIAPTERKTRIETGKGVGDRLTDIDCAIILRERVGPLLKEDRFRDAIEAAVEAIEAALDGRPTPDLPASLTAMPVVPGAFIVDVANALDESTLGKLEVEAAREGRYWAGFGIVVVPEADPTGPGVKAAGELIAKRKSMPAFRLHSSPRVLLVGASDRRVVALTFIVAHGYDQEATERRLTAIVKEAQTLEAAVRAVARDQVAAARWRESTEREAARAAEVRRKDEEKRITIVLVVVIVAAILLLVVLPIWLGIRAARRGGGWSSDGSSSSSSSEPYVSSYESSSSSSSSVDTSYSGGGGSSGGGGASDSY